MHTVKYLMIILHYWRKLAVSEWKWKLTHSKSLFFEKLSELRGKNVYIYCILFLLQVRLFDIIISSWKSIDFFWYWLKKGLFFELNICTFSVAVDTSKIRYLNDDSKLYKVLLDGIVARCTHSALIPIIPSNEFAFIHVKPRSTSSK